MPIPIKLISTGFHLGPQRSIPYTSHPKKKFLLWWHAMGFVSYTVLIE
jgi:hypothetical protein